MDVADTARRLPKVLLHDHLDGGLRAATLLELLRARGLPAPADDANALAAWFDANAHAGSLTKYLEGFALTVAAMASPAALERVAFEAAEDALAQGCVLAEFRIAPLLFEPHGIDGDAAVEALLAGLARSRLPSGLIVCGRRPPSRWSCSSTLGMPSSRASRSSSELIASSYPGPPEGARGGAAGPALAILPGNPRSRPT